MTDANRREFLRTSGVLLGGIAIGTQVTAATRTDRFIAQTKGKKTPDDLDVVHEMPGVKYLIVEGEEKDLKQSKKIKDYSADVTVELSDPDPNEDAPESVEDTSVADEPLYPLQWDKQDLDVGTAHDTTKGEESTVTVIDTGVAAGHPDLDVDESLSRNFTGDGLGSANPAGGYHGTHVAGIIGASDNGEGVIGTAPGTTLVDCRVFSPNDLASFGDILAAVVYSASIGADAANLSLGAYPIPRQGQGSFYGKVLNSVMTYANKEGTLLVIAAGNDSADLQHDKNFISLPNEGAQACSVAATGPVGFAWDAEDEQPPETPAKYTNYGTNAITLAAPGGNYTSKITDDDQDNDPAFWYYDLVLNTVAIPTYETNEDDEIIGIEDVDYTYSWVAGTSMAAPQVAGAAALVKSANDDLNANQVESTLKKTAEVPDDYDKPYYGSGYLDVVGAVEEADSGGDDDDDGDENGGGNGNNGNGNSKGKGNGKNK